MSGDERVCIRSGCGHTFNDHHSHGACSICRCGDFIAQAPLNCVRQGCFHPKSIHNVVGQCATTGCLCAAFISVREALPQVPLEAVKDAPAPPPIPMLLWCPLCHARHIDEGEFATKSHKNHSCQSCGLTWQPCKLPTVGVQFLPGYKDGDPR